MCVCVYERGSQPSNASCSISSTPRTPRKKEVKGLEYQEDDGRLFHREKGSETI